MKKDGGHIHAMEGGEKGRKGKGPLSGEFCYVGKKKGTRAVRLQQCKVKGRRRPEEKRKKRRSSPVSRRGREKERRGGRVRNTKSRIRREGRTSTSSPRATKTT